jgi:hypothetical protein
MKANNTQDKFAHILKLLREAAHVEFYADMRRRFASNEQWKVEGPEIQRHAAICWFAAKRSIGEDREALNKYIKDNKDKFGESDFNTFQAALKVIDKEVETQFEQQFLKEDEMVKQSIDNEFDEEVELDEDEAYIRETEGTWDGDDYVAVSDDEELEDYDLIEEE